VSKFPRWSRAVVERPPTMHDLMHGPCAKIGRTPPPVLLGPDGAPGDKVRATRTARTVCHVSENRCKAAIFIAIRCATSFGASSRILRIGNWSGVVALLAVSV